MTPDTSRRLELADEAAAKIDQHGYPAAIGLLVRVLEHQLGHPSPLVQLANNPTTTPRRRESVELLLTTIGGILRQHIEPSDDDDGGELGEPGATPPATTEPAVMAARLRYLTDRIRNA